MVGGENDGIALTRLRLKSALFALLVWGVMSALMLWAYKLTGRPIGISGWLSVGSTPPMIVGSALVLVEVVRRHHAAGRVRRLALPIAALVLLAVACGTLDTAKDHWLMDVLEPQPHPAMSVSMLLRYWIDFALIFGVVTTMIFAWIEQQRLAADQLGIAAERQAEQDAHLARTRAEAQRTEARIATLRYQLKPQFLFSTLDVLSSLVITRQTGRADELLARLSHHLRFSLQAANRETSTLEVELEAVQSFLEIEHYRLRDRLEVRIEAEPALAEVEVPTLLIQALVEAAVQQATAGKAGRARLAITAREQGGRLKIEVIDEGGDEAGVGPSARAELARFREQLSALHGADARLSLSRPPQPFGARVDLPLPRALDVAA